MTRRTTPAPRPRAAGFTLVELLATVAIVSILVALLASGVMRVYAAARRTQASTDANDLATACLKFKQDFGFYPPTSFTIPTTGTAATDPSLILLKRMFPRWDNTATPPDSFVLTTADSNMAPVVKNPGDSLASGNQCLIYFLAGPQGTGWHPTKPSAPAGSTKKGPYKEFPTNRILSDPAAFRGMYGDPWKTPYLYIASSSAGYPTAQVDGVWPYREGGNTTTGQGSKPVNQDGIQIISAGPNMKFGPGSEITATSPLTCKIWVPGSSGTFIAPYTENDDGADDIANFNGGVPLGATP